LAVSVVLLAACAVEPEPTLTPVGQRVVATLDETTVSIGISASESEQPYVCTLAAQLPPDDVCSQICDPDALEAALLAEGVEPGRCYLLICELPEDVVAKVGVCL
jgi:hypothetical protein